MNTRRTFLADVMRGSAAAVAGPVTLRSDAMARVWAASQAPAINGLPRHHDVTARY
jgi:hypothetical protein